MLSVTLTRHRVSTLTATPAVPALDRSAYFHVMRYIVTILAIATFTLTGCETRYDRSPKTQIIEMAFFTCPKCGSLSGGIFGKGPTRHYRSDSAARCVHNWKSITKSEFQRQATDRFGIDWSSEKYFWSVVSERR
jgi:hypothetical protein